MSSSSPRLSSSILAVVGASLLVLANGWLSSFLRRRLGLEGLELAAWLSLGLTCASIVVLPALFISVREGFVQGARTFTNRRVLTIAGVVVIGNLLLFILALVAPVARPMDVHVGWAHYLGLPPENRPFFLLHALLVSALESTILSPVMEELLHVGVVVRMLRAAQMPIAAILVVDALLFIVIHHSGFGTWIGWNLAIVYGFARVFLDWLFLKTDNIAVPILAHVLNNTRVLALTVLTLL